MRLAIQPDYVRQPNGEEQSFSARWIELAEQRGIEVVLVDTSDHAATSLISECDGFLWRYGYDRQSRAMAKRILPAIEHGLGIPVFPSSETSWHFEDKVAQRYLLETAGMPAPETWVFWTKEDALAFADAATYPLVVKLSAGIRSGNVVLVKTAAEARWWIRQMFGLGIDNMDDQRSRGPALLRIAKDAARFVLDRPVRPREHHGYFFAQEFLPDNAFDTRVTVIGNRAFAFRRFNRDDDFRSSGSGKISWDPAEIDLDTIRLAFTVARKLRTQSIAIDGMRRGERRLVGEISYTYAAWAVRDCPGHWRMNGGGELAWVEGSLRPEDAIFHDFVDRVQGRMRGPLSEIAVDA